MFIEESRLGRHHWQQNMAPLLQRLAHTLSYVLQGQPAPSGTWGCLAVKVGTCLRKACTFFRGEQCWRPSSLCPPFLQACLQLFQVMPKDVAPLVWSAAAKNEALQRILGLLLEAVAGKVRAVLLLQGQRCPPLLLPLSQGDITASEECSLPARIMHRG